MIGHNTLNFIQQLLIWGIPVLFAITIHEVAHGWVAKCLGDYTAARLGRLTLNPIKHIDLVGTIIVPLALLLLGSGILFGWAKPVPIDWRALKSPRRDTAVVAAAGPIANLVMAFFWVLVIKICLLLSTEPETGLALALIYMGEAGILINILLMIFNLLPIPPLDGSRVLASLLSPLSAQWLARIEPYGFFILIVLLFLGLGKFISLPVAYLRDLLFTLAGV